jgi:hypothetical protein
VAEGLAEWAALKEGVQRVLQSVPEAGTVETRSGGVGYWFRQGKPGRTYWEVSITANALRGAGVGTVGFEAPALRIEGFMPWSWETNSEEFWDVMVWETLNALLRFPTLGNLADGWKQAGLPQLVRNDRVTVTDAGPEGVPCHRCQIEMIRGERYFTYSVQATF